MAQKDGIPLATNPRKRKDPPAPQKVRFASNNNNKKQKVDHRSRLQDARAISTQTASNAFHGGELDVDKFVKAREYEIRSLEKGMQRSRKALNQRAFQQVPRELRRRTASHDAKRVPKRLRARAKKEMVQDQTPTVNSRTRKVTGHQRLRTETAKKLRTLGARKEKQSNVEDMQGVEQEAAPAAKPDFKTTIETRTPHVKKTALAKPPLPKAKFRKRQLEKSWLPTHIFHAKRAHMTLPRSPLWRFAISLTPTQKSYRPIHRAARGRGAVAWDTSYMSTINLSGQQKSIEGLLKALGVDMTSDSRDIQRWQQGSQVLETFVYEREAPHLMIAPVTIIWCAESTRSPVASAPTAKQTRKVFLRVHPSAFHQVWEEVIRLSKVAKPSVSVEDLRYEIGSIEITGPGSTETLLGALWPYEYSSSDRTETRKEEALGADVGNLWTSLAGVTNPSALPSNALLAFEAQDPRLHHPPRTISLPTTDHEQHKLLETIATWPVHGHPPPSLLFDRSSRLKASRLPSQKSINRRKSLTLPGDVNKPTAADPRIPVMLYVSTNSDRKQQSSWTLLLPWKCVQPFWYSVVFYPLSTGEQPRFGGLHQKRQLALENGQPWFPADFPGSQAGWEWEVRERQLRKDEWARRPRAKRTSWEKVDIGNGRKGEVGEGWSCHWELLLDPVGDGSPPSNIDASIEKKGNATATAATLQDPFTASDAPEASSEHEEHTGARLQAEFPQANPVEGSAKRLPKPNQLTQLSAAQAHEHLRKSSADIPPGALATISVTAVTRGVPETCARIYRLPFDAKQRQRWLDLQPSRQSKSSKKKKTSALPSVDKNLPPHEIRRRLAQSLLEPPSAADEGTYVPCPGAEDLVGFVTSGNFNLAEGKGVGLGCIALSRVAEGLRNNREEGGFCVVRNAGESVARLARWKIV